MFVISSQMDMNSFNELTCGVNRQDPDYELYNSGGVYIAISGNADLNSQGASISMADLLVLAG